MVKKHNRAKKIIREANRPENLAMIGKKILLLFVQTINIGFSAILGGFSHLAVTGWYPYVIPGVLGLGGPIVFIALQGKTVKYASEEKTSKFSIVTSILTVLTGIISFIFGMVYAFSTFIPLGAGMMYGVFSKRNPKD